MIEGLDYLREVNTASVLLRLTLAMFCGGMIGLERARKHRPAGFRTYMLVCMAAALTMLLSQYESFMLNHAWAERAAEIGIRTDVSRFGAQVINGIGFLGAGTILVTGQQKVKGLTTAAGLWAAAIIGLALGGGFYEGGLFATVLIMVAELFFSRVEYRMLKNAPEVNLYVEYSDNRTMDVLLQEFREHGLKILNMGIIHSNSNEKHNACAIFTLRLHKGLDVEHLQQEIRATAGVVSVREL